MNLEQLEADYTKAKEDFINAEPFNAALLPAYINMVRVDLIPMLKLESNPLKAVAYYLAAHKLSPSVTQIHKAAALQIQAEREATKP